MLISISVQYRISDIGVTSRYPIISDIGNFRYIHRILENWKNINILGDVGVEFTFPQYFCVTLSV